MQCKKWPFWTFSKIIIKKMLFKHYRKVFSNRVRTLLRNWIFRWDSIQVGTLLKSRTSNEDCIRVGSPFEMGLTLRYVETQKTRLGGRDRNIHFLRTIVKNWQIIYQMGSQEIKRILYHKGACTNHVDKRGGGVVAQMTTTLNNSYLVKVST